MQKRRKDGEPTALELEVAKACADVVESSSSAETKAAMSHMRIIQAKEVEVETTGKKVLQFRSSPWQVHIIFTYRLWSFSRPTNRTSCTSSLTYKSV